MIKEKYNKLTEEQKNKEREGCLKRYYKNREKLIAKNKEWKINNKERNALTKYSSNIKTSYNITIDIYNKMFDEQKGRCKICGRHQSEFKKRLSVDHCHETLKVRGLLCSKCNMGIGHFKDNIDLLKSAIEYLKGMSLEQANLLLNNNHEL